LGPEGQGLDSADFMVSALHKALGALAKEDQNAFLHWADRLKSSRLLLFHQVLCDVLNEQAVSYASWACQYLLEHSDRFLVDVDGAGTYFSSRLVAASFPHLTPDEKTNLERAIVEFYPPWTQNLAKGPRLDRQEQDERRYILQRLHRRRRAQLELLEKVPNDALTPAGLKIKRELERRYPGYRLPDRRPRTGMVEVKSPIPADRLGSLTDDELIVAMRHFDEHTEDDAIPRFYGKAKLVAKLDLSIANQYVGAALEGLIESDLDSRSLFQACREAMANHSEATEVKEALCRATEKRLKDGVPSDIREQVRRIAVSVGPSDGRRAETLIDHDDRMWSLSLRASALRAWALCYLDGTDANPNDALPTLEALTRDPDVSVRQSLIELMRYFLHLDRDRVSAIFECTVAHDPNLLETSFSARFIQHNLYRNAPSMLKYIEHMMGSELAEARKRGANLAALANFHCPPARYLYRQCVRGDDPQRLGLAEVFACNVDKQELLEQCLEGMTQLMNDQDEAVRRELGTAFVNLPPPSVKIDHFISKLLRSRALPDIAHSMMEYLQQHYLSIPKLTLDAAEEVHARVGKAMVDISSEHALVDSDIVGAVVAIYNHCPEMRERAMSIFERIMHIGSRCATKALESAGR